MTVGYYRLPDVDGTPKYCQNASEVAVGSCTPSGRARSVAKNNPIRNDNEYRIIRISFEFYSDIVFSCHGTTP